MVFNEYSRDYLASDNNGDVPRKTPFFEKQRRENAFVTNENFGPFRLVFGLE